MIGVANRADVASVANVANITRVANKTNTHTILHPGLAPLISK